MTQANPVAAFAALGDDTRWSILQTLGRSSATVSQLTATLPITRQAVARHLGLLLDAGLLQSEARGREVYYTALGSELSQLGALLADTARGWDARLARLKVVVEAAAESHR